MCCVTLFFIKFITLFFTTYDRTEKKVNEKGNTFEEEEEDRKKNQEAPDEMTTTTTAKRRGKGKSGYDATRDGENTRLQQDAARGKGAWDCEKYEEIRPEDEAKVFEEIATANEDDFLFEGERCCS